MTKHVPKTPTVGAYRAHEPGKDGARDTAAVTKAADFAKTEAKPAASPAKPDAEATPRPKEIGGPKGPEPTRFGDWERDGRCVDF